MSMTRLTYILCGLFATCSLAGAPTLALTRAVQPPVIDGRLDDAAWQSAARIDEFTQVLPRSGEAPTERTEVWITYDSGHLYIAIRCHEQQPDRVLATQLQRDASLKSDDSVRIVIDTFNRQRDGYYFEVNPAGARIDGLIEHNNEPALEWDTIWQARSQIDEGGWTAEIAIPTTSLAFDPSGSNWGFNIERMIRRFQEKDRWSGHASARDVEYLPDSGTLMGIENLHQGRGVEFRPFVSAKHTALSSSPEDKGTQFKPGFDLLWHVTPALSTTLTVNTDFAETDVDDRDVNLGRFPRFFPEKRAFFLQDAPLFAFGNINYNPRPFFSRRIGLTPKGQPVDILAGVKLTGRQGPVTIGLLHTQVDSFANVDSKNLFVGRVAFQVSEAAAIGLLGTRGEPRANGDNSTLGVDFNYILSHLSRDRSLELHTWLVGTDSDLAGGRDAAGAIQLLYPNEPFKLELFAGRYGNRYDPGLGFVSRPGINELIADGQMRWRNPFAATRKIDVHGSLQFITDLPGNIESEDHETSIKWEDLSNDEVTAGMSFEREVLNTPFRIHPGNVIPVGDYRFARFFTDFNFSPSRILSGKVSFESGEFYNGSREDYEAEATWTPSRHTHFGTAYELRSIHLPGGDFQVRVASVRADFLFSPDLSLNTLAQYDNDSRKLGVNIRLKWIMVPGNEIFLVLNQGYDVDENRFTSIQSDITAKAAWTLRF